MKISTHLKTVSSGLCLLLLTSLAPSVHVVALASSTGTDSASCSTLSNKQQAFQARFTTKQSALTTTWQNQATKLQTIVTSEDASIAKIRGQVDTERTANQSALMTKASTTDEKAAVTAYDQSITAATQARRSTVDSARTNFRNGVTTLVTNRQAAVAGRVAAFQISVNDAFMTASNSCTDQTEAPTIRAALLQSLADARQTFESQRTSDTSNTDLQTLSSARNQAIRTANNTFLQTTAAARQTLKTAFGKDVGSI